MPIALLTVLLDQASDRFFDALIRSNQERKAATVTANQTVVQGGSSTALRFVVAYQRPTSLRIEMAGKVLWAGPNGVLALDSASKRYVKSAWNPKKSLAENVGASGVAVDAVLMGFVDPAGMRKILLTMKSANRWTFRSGVAGVVATASGPNGTISVTKMPNGDLTDLQIKSKTAAIHWTFKYGPMTGSLVPTLPKGATQIRESAVAEKGPPSYLDEGARKATERAFQAYDLLTRLAYRVTGPDGETSVWYDGDYVRERTPVMDRVYQPGRFLLLDSGAKRAYQGSIRFAAVQKLMDKVNLTWDPLLRDLVKGRNPIRSMLSPEFKAKRTGSLVLGGHPCTLVQFTRPKLRLTLVIRDDNGLVMRSTAEPLDADGRPVSVADRTYAYSSFRLPLGRKPFEIEVPQGWPVVALDRLPVYR